MSCNFFLWGFHFIFFKLWIFSLFLNITEINNSFKTDDLIHMIYSNLEIMLFFKAFDALMITACHVLLKVKSYIIAEVSFDNIREWIRNLSFGRKHPPDQTCARNRNVIYLFKVDIIWKTFFNKRFNVKLEVHPHAFHYVGTRNSRMEWLPVDIVFAICIELSSIENKSSSFPLEIWKLYFKMKWFFVQNFALHYNVWLY